MTWCSNQVNCPTLDALEKGWITDKRPTDFDPSFPSDFTYTEKGVMEKLRQLLKEMPGDERRKALELIIEMADTPDQIVDAIRQVRLTVEVDLIKRNL